jgi:polysaccharide pyruvyl transferase WcaK-like protein
VSRRGSAARQRAPRIGIFGLLGAGNAGNDGSLESMLGYLQAAYPNAIIDAMCTGPAGVRTRFGVDAVPLLWCQQYQDGASRAVAAAAKVAGKAVDVVRIAAWTRRHDLVIISGAGVLEASLPLHPWGLPYALLLLCAWGRVFRTKVAFVSVGASGIKKRATRWLFTAAARLACYRSYRDEYSRDAMEKRGLDTSRDPVYTDLAFALPVPDHDAGDPLVVGLGVMAFYGGNDERQNASQIHARYVDNMKTFVRWLLDTGHTVRLFTGDAVDDVVVEELMTHVREQRPSCAARISAPPVPSLDLLLEAMAPAGAVVATRYHNLICAAKLGKPAISVSYSPKHDVLMADIGLAQFHVDASRLDAEQLIRQFTELESRSAELRHTMQQRTARMAERLQEQFALLSSLLLPEYPIARAAPSAESPRRPAAAATFSRGSARPVSLGSAEHQHGAGWRRTE